MDVKPSHTRIPEEIFIQLSKNPPQNDDFISLKKVNSTKYLGIQIDTNWKFEDHVNVLVTKLRQIMPKIYHIRHMLNKKNRKLIYDALIESNIRYGIEIYGNATKTTITKLQNIQNKIIKVLFQTGKQKARNIMKSQNILSIQSLTDYVTLIKYYFELSNKYCKLKQSTSLRNTNLFVPIWRNFHGKMRKKYYATTKFNSLPFCLKELPSFNELKRQLKAHMIQKQ